MGKPGKEKNTKSAARGRGRGRGGPGRGAWNGAGGGRGRLPRAAKRLDQEGFPPVSIIEDGSEDEEEGRLRLC
jgi:hypothetical protein